MKDFIFTTACIFGLAAFTFIVTFVGDSYEGFREKKYGNKQSEPVDEEFF